MSTWISWSAGKDSAYATGLSDDVAGLVTTVVGDHVAMSRVPLAVLHRQAEALGLPLVTVELPWPCPNEVYERRTAAAWASIRERGGTRLVFGDLHLGDIRAYREATLRGSGLAPEFPLWHRPTGELAREMLAAGVRALVVCVDPALAPAGIVGRVWDAALLAELPAGVDPCGENGEFHTVALDGPGFGAPVDVEVVGTEERDGFVFAMIR